MVAWKKNTLRAEYNQLPASSIPTFVQPFMELIRAGEIRTSMLAGPTLSSWSLTPKGLLIPPGNYTHNIFPVHSPLLHFSFTPFLPSNFQHLLLHSHTKLVSWFLIQIENRSQSENSYRLPQQTEYGSVHSVFSCFAVGGSAMPLSGAQPVKCITLCLIQPLMNIIQLSFPFSSAFTHFSSLISHSLQCINMLFLSS